MAIKNIEDISKNAIFGKKLFSLGDENDMQGPAAIAIGLYNNSKCYELIKPRGRETKYLVNKKKDVDAIAKNVQRHFNLETPYAVPGNYMMAYSILFNCSMDYLYGIIKNKCPNVEIDAISKKLGISTKAIENLLMNNEICMEEYLQPIYNYGLWDSPELGDYDSELNDYFVNTNGSVNHFWSLVLESAYFEKIPSDWYRMSSALYVNKAIKLIATHANQQLNELPTLDDFLSWVENWFIFYPDKPLAPPLYSGWEETYKKNPDYIKQVYRELRHEHLYSSIDNQDNFETIYWGTAGKFDRSVLDFFHSAAEKWCVSGQFPNLWEDENQFIKL